MTNQSVTNFKRFTAQLNEDVRKVAGSELMNQATLLARAIAAAAPTHAGTLRQTVHVNPTNSDMTVRVVAGGQATTRPEVSTSPYDYARADEFGTVKMPAHPFFFPTYNRMKLGMIAAMRGQIKSVIDKNSAHK